MTSPRSVTRGEVGKAPASGKALVIDWLAFTFFPPESGPFWPALEHFLAANFDARGYDESSKGWNGYTRSGKIGGCLIAWGGAHQGGSVHVEIPGAICAQCSDFSTVVEWLQLWGARLTRVDLACDDFAGEDLSVDWAIAQYQADGFTGPRAPCRPKAKLWDDLGSGEGRTLYVGSSANGKLARVYEKGKQLGDKLSRWCRFEVQFGTKDRVLPFDMLVRPAAYLAGSFPCASMFSAVSERVRTFREKAMLSFGQLIAIARRQSGRAINAMMFVTGGDLGQVVSLLRRSGLPSRIDPADITALAGAT